MTLQLANCSIKRPCDVVEDVLVKVQYFTFLIDFVVMDMEGDPEVPLIMGQPFMLTVRCVVDMGNENLELSVEDHKMTFNLFEAMKHPSDHKTCFRVQTIEQEAKNVVQQFTMHSLLEKALVNAIDCLTNEEEKELKACLEDLDESKEVFSRGILSKN